MKKCKKGILIEMKKVFILGVALLTSIFTSCTIPFLNIENANITDISEEMTFQKIMCQSFMGGSILYNPDKPSTGQLAKGVTVAIRLGYVEKEEKNIDEIVYTNNEDKARYGYITIDSINKNEISFSYFSFDKEGLCKTKSIYSLRRGESIDINSDGLNDLKYDYPKRKRPSFENALWLTFLSNQETLNTSMFAVLPTQYERSIYPSGIMGINPYGKFILNKYEVNSSNRAAVQGAIYGDYVLDTQTGEYQKLISYSSYRTARNIEESELETIIDNAQVDFYFKIEEFDIYMSVDGLLNKLPQSILPKVNENLSDIEKLNYILEQKNLLNEIAIEKGYSIDLPEIQEINAYLDTTTQEEVVKFNRYLLEAFYPENCPILDVGNDSIATIFPLLSVYIANPENDYTEEQTEIQRSADTIGTASSYTDYLRKKQKIVDKFADFHPIKNFSYEFPGWDKLFEISNTNSTTTTTNNKETTDLKGNMGTLNDMFSTLFVPPKTDIPGKVENKTNLKLGIMGHFTSSFSNIEAGIYVGVFLSGDTSLDMTKILAKNSIDNIPKVGISTNEKLLKIDLKFFEAPPINIGVLSLKFSLCGGIEIPASVTLSGTITTNYYAGFTGFYAVGFDVGADFGIKYKIKKILGIPIKIPTNFYFYPYSQGKVINETASFVGPVSEVKTIPGAKLQAGKLELVISPSIFVEPGITIANCLYGGLKIAPYVDLGVGLKFNIDDTQQMPKSLELYSLFGTGIDVDGTYGIKISIPIINKSVQKTGIIDFRKNEMIKRHEIPITKIDFTL